MDGVAAPPIIGLRQSVLPRTTLRRTPDAQEQRARHGGCGRERVLHSSDHFDERVLELLERGAGAGYLQLSQVQAVLEEAGLDADDEAALLDEIAAREIPLHDDGGREHPGTTYVNGYLALAVVICARSGQRVPSRVEQDSHCRPGTGVGLLLGFLPHFPHPC